jgi:hypothetical protein
LIVAILVGVGLIARFIFLRSIVARARRAIANGAYQPFGAVQSHPSDTRNGQRSDGQCLLSVFQSKTIVSAAMFEGWAFLAVIAYLIDGGPISIALAVLLALAVAAHFPTQSRVIRWVEQQLDAVEQKRRDIVA